MEIVSSVDICIWSTPPLSVLVHTSLCVCVWGGGGGGG